MTQLQQKLLKKKIKFRKIKLLQIIKPKSDKKIYLTIKQTIIIIKTSTKNRPATIMLKSQQSFQQKTLKHDINSLLTLFNELDFSNDGFLSILELEKLFNRIGVDLSTFQTLNLDDMDKFQFDDVLSFLGLIQVPEQPSIYLLSFVKVLAEYRNKCIQRDPNDEKGLIQAKEIGDRIKALTKNQLQRRKKRLLEEHNKIYEEMNRTQNTQFNNFQEEWKKYLLEFRSQTYDRMQKAKNQKIKELSFQSNKLAKTARRHSVVTSTKLRQLLEKKKWLVKQGKYADAIRINYLIDAQKRKIEDHKQESLDFTLRKRVQSMKKKNQTALSYIQDTMHLNMNKLLSKKKEGEHLMQLRMKNLRQEAQRKLNDHLRGELGRLKAAFGRASR